MSRSSTAVSVLRAICHVIPLPLYIWIFRSISSLSHGYDCVNVFDFVEYFALQYDSASRVSKEYPTPDPHALSVAYFRRA